MRKRPDALSAGRRQQQRSRLLGNLRSRTTATGSRSRATRCTDRETVENYLLYRAAELTLQNGFDAFTVVNRDIDKDSRTRQYGGLYGPAPVLHVLRARLGLGGRMGTVLDALAL